MKGNKAASYKNNNMSRFKVGQVIEFNRGYNNDIRTPYTITKIEGDCIYVNWDCYWHSIKDTKERNIKILQDV